VAFIIQSVCTGAEHVFCLHRVALFWLRVVEVDSSRVIQEQ
jgi:hypothetical protein